MKFFELLINVILVYCIVTCTNHLLNVVWTVQTPFCSWNITQLLQALWFGVCLNCQMSSGVCVPAWTSRNVVLCSSWISDDLIFLTDVGFSMPSVLWCCWLGGRKGTRPVKTERWCAVVVICLERGADLHMAQLMPLPLTVSCFSKIQIGSTFLVPAYPSSPGKRAVKRVCVCVCVCVSVSLLKSRVSTTPGNLLEFGNAPGKF